MSTYDLYKNKSYNLRLPAETKKKFEIIAQRQGYKKTSHAYLDVIEKYIQAYESQYGEIKLDPVAPEDIDKK